MNSNKTAFALEGYLRKIDSFAGLDGFNSFHIVEETSNSLRVAGLAYFLPSSLLPLDATFKNTEQAISYKIWLSLDDKIWKDLATNKKWKAFHLYATEGNEIQWNWDRPFEGKLDI